MKKLLEFLKKETVLTVASLLALASAFVIPPDKAYLGYIDFRTLGILFGLMSVMAGLRSRGVFDRLGSALLGRTRTLLQVVLALTLLCFFGSMVITNDVALITFVPFTFVVLSLMGGKQAEKWAVPVVGMQTIAANLGSMLTPIGNPQNLYLYGLSGLSFGSFLLLMLPYALCALVLLLLWAAVLCAKEHSAITFAAPKNSPFASADKRIVGVYLLLFAAALAGVARVLPVGVMFAAVLLFTAVFDRETLQKVDYSLLATFVAFFIFIGNLGRIPAFSGWLQRILSGREVLVSVLASQVTSNVPAALLLSGFTSNVKGLIVGTNLGGLGTLIASMASLISYRQICAGAPEKKGAFFRLFTVSNVSFLVLLLAFHYLVMA